MVSCAGTNSYMGGSCGKGEANIKRGLVVVGSGNSVYAVTCSEHALPIAAQTCRIRASAADEAYLEFFFIIAPYKYSYLLTYLLTYDTCKARAVSSLPINFVLVLSVLSLAYVDTAFLQSMKDWNDFLDQEPILASCLLFRIIGGLPRYFR